MTEESGAPASGPSKHKVLNLDLLMGPKATAQTSIGTVYLYSLRASDISEFRKLRADDPAERVREFLPCIASLSERSSFKEEREPLPTELAAQLTEADLDALGTAYASPTVLGAAREYHQCSLSERVGTTWKSACKPAQHLKYSVIRTVFNQITLWVRARLELGDSYSGAFAIFLNPPFGVKWEMVQKKVQEEQKNLGFAGRFGAGLPRVGDGSLLFLMHLLSKRKPVQQGGSRIGIVLSGSPLFNGGAGSGESEIRRWILENDWLEAIIALPNDLFYNTGIGTYVWVLSNHKDVSRKDKVQLIDATAMHAPMRKSLGSKRRFLSEEQIAEIARQHDGFEALATSKIFNTTDFGYRRITVERPLRLRFAVTAENLATYRDTKGAEYADAFASLLESGAHFDDLPSFLRAAKVKKLGKGAQKAVFACFGTKCPEAEPIKDVDGSVLPDSDLRENENVPLDQGINEYFKREVLPHVPDAWIDESKRDEKDGQVGIVGYEINFNRYFYQYQPPRKLADIDADLKAVEAEIAALLNEVTA